MTDMIKIFVYGTLRKHEDNHIYIEGSKCIAEQGWVYGELYDTGLGYPAVKPSLESKTYGEIFEITAEQLKEVDQLEGFVEGAKDNLYERVIQTVHTDKGTVDAYIYISERMDMLGEPILDGDWKLYRFLQEQPETFFYFAYGSCMDTERFQKAGVGHLFTKVKGSGILDGYSMKYLFARPDGGRADIIEDGGVTEGIVYDVPFEAADYLFRREGFRGGWYRPAFVDIKVGEKLLTNVLTFHVYNKKEELAPPVHYAVEILRGSKGRLSTEYYQKLESELYRLGLLKTI
ncbi:gamma-glutamylcyclotransferase [Bacillus sp. V3-13]|uniref:gamma-glutamylcyclotransferase n=1 Tax=Bacillus sp. V3-13 TaxID=2053728 RepID=UPI0021529B69|nr:gamma-glutamylcyclotransferase family protein [Bacillus sp. V3-13]